MNERIQALAEQAGFIDRGTNHTVYMNFDHEKLAELIVRDCMLICEDVMKKDNSALGCWSEIKRTFRS